MGNAIIPSAADRTNQHWRCLKQVRLAKERHQNFVATLSKAKWNDGNLTQDYAQVDLIRIENGKVVHWHRSSGIRYDFTFVILRFDTSFPVRKQYLEPGSRWVFNQIDLSSKEWYNQNLVFNIAIGYPF